MDITCSQSALKGKDIGARHDFGDWDLHNKFLMALNIKTKVKKYYNGILSKGKYSWLDVKQQIASQWFTHWSIIPKVYY